LALSLLTSAFCQDEDRWKKYEPRTLDSIVKINRPLTEGVDSKKAALLLSADSFTSQVRLVYLGKSRPLSDEDKKLLVAWQKALRDTIPPNIVKLFPTEHLFKEGSETYWIAIQKPLLNTLSKEVREGQAVNTYIIFVGASE